MLSLRRASASERLRVLDHRDCRPGPQVYIGLVCISCLCAGASFACFHMRLLVGGFVLQRLD